MSVSERHYSIQELADLWKLSRNSVRHIFYRRSDVLHLGHDEIGRGKDRTRAYYTIRIPESVGSPAQSQTGWA